MARRDVKNSKFNSLNQVVPEVIAVVSTKDDNEQLQHPQSYFKRNYIEALKKIIPPFYFSDEQALSGLHIPHTSQLLNTHLIANKHQTTILPVSALAEDTYLSAINTPSGFARYFFKEQTPATIAPDDFERNFLLPLNKAFGDYATSQSFIDYISGTFLPSIPAVGTVDKDLATLTASAYAADSSGTYKYLANNLGWLFFLNREGPAYGYDPSTAIAALITDNLWHGKSIVLEDTINIYQEYLWRNESYLGVDDIIPEGYASSVAMSADVWTSGTQLLDRLKTLNEVVYSPHFLNSADKFVEDAFTSYITTDTQITSERGAGPFSRFLEAISYSIADRVTEANELNTLYDIGKCPEELLELLAQLIGWRVIGADVDKWRVQLRNAVSIYKMKGTKRSIQVLLNVLFGDDLFNVDTHVKELWESYIPDLIYYSLATSSEAFKDFTTYTPDLSRQLGILDYSSSSMDTNIRYAVDTILFNLVREFPRSFMLGGKPFPQLVFVLASDDSYIWDGPYHFIIRDDSQVYRTGITETADSVDLEIQHDPNFVFQYRNRVFYIPPYERRQYYSECTVNDGLLDRLEFYLTCYGVDSSFAESIIRYIREYTTETIDTTRLVNTFLLFGTYPTYPPNYATIISDVTRARTPDPASLLSMWNGKSSHFIMLFDASSFDWASNALNYNTGYGIKQMLTLADQVVPAHAIPEVVLNLSSVADGMEALADKDCRQLRPNFDDLYEGSSNVTTNWGLSALNMNVAAQYIGLLPNRFKRINVKGINDVMLSGTGDSNEMYDVRYAYELGVYDDPDPVAGRFSYNDPFDAGIGAANPSLINRAWFNASPKSGNTFDFTTLEKGSQIIMIYQGLTAIHHQVYELTELGSSSTGTYGPVWNFENLKYVPQKTVNGGIPYPIKVRSCDIYFETDFTPVPRNSLRRRNYHHLLPETKFFSRIGRNNPGSLQLSNSYYTSSIGYLPLGFIPSSQDFEPVQIIQNRNGYGIGDVLYKVHPVWDICQNLTSPSSMFGYDISNTFASRAKLNLQSSSCLPYGRRGQLDDIIYVMNKVHDKEKFLQASSIVSGYYTTKGGVYGNWEPSTPLVVPNDLSSWYAEGASEGWPISVVPSVANALINAESEDDSLSYYEHFKFGMPVQRLYNTYNNTYSGHALSDNYSLQAGGPNIFSHTYGPLVYNSNFNTGGSALEVSSYLQASSPLNAPDISYYGGSGVLSISGMTGEFELGTESLSAATDVYLNKPEFFNKFLVSGLDLLDTSSGALFRAHPVFSLYKLTRSVVNRFNYNKYLVNNAIIKYHRPKQSENFPRLRMRIDNSDDTNKARNFLEPDHKYCIKIVAHNSDISSVFIGGQTLGVTLRTEAEDGKVWVYRPQGIYDECGVRYDEWFQYEVKVLQNRGISTMKSNAQTYTFPIKEAESTSFDPDREGNPERVRCYEGTGKTLDPNPQAIIKIGETTKENIEMYFTTNNDKGCVPPDSYSDKFGKVHRTDQKYVLEFFVMEGNDTKFVVFEDISLQDLTNKDDFALIRTNYGDVPLDKKDLKSVFRFFKDMQTGIASRNAVITSGVMEASGGSRMNYRTNYEMYHNTTDASYEQVTEVDTYEG